MKERVKSRNAKHVKTAVAELSVEQHDRLFAPYANHHKSQAPPAPSARTTRYPELSTARLLWLSYRTQASTALLAIDRTRHNGLRGSSPGRDRRVTRARDALVAYRKAVLAPPVETAHSKFVRNLNTAHEKHSGKITIYPQRLPSSSSIMRL